MTDTAGSGATRLFIDDDTVFGVPTADDVTVWTSAGGAVNPGPEPSADREPGPGPSGPGATDPGSGEPRPWPSESAAPDDRASTGADVPGLLTVALGALAVGAGAVALRSQVRTR